MKRRSPTLIKSPLAWRMADVPVGPPIIPVLAERGGTQLRSPRPAVVVDTREQNPLDFSRFEGWFAGIERRALNPATIPLQDWKTIAWSSARTWRISCTRLRRVGRFS